MGLKNYYVKRTVHISWFIIITNDILTHCMTASIRLYVMILHYV